MKDSKRSRTIKNFLKAGNIIGIVCLVLFAICALVYLVCGIIMIATGDDAVLAGGIVLIAVGLPLFAFVLIPMNIVSLVLNKKARKGIFNAKTKSEAKKYGVLAIVSGALVTIFGIPAGIMTLTARDDDFDNVIDVK